jgi:hypothetical protein
LIDRRDPIGLLRFLRAWTNTSPFSSDRVAFELIWRSALRPKAARTARTMLGPLFSGISALRSGRYLLPPPSIGKEIEARTVRPPLAERETHYLRALRELIASPVLAMELDQAEVWLEERGVLFLYPFYDRDLMERALRIDPALLYAGGRMKEPLRSLVAKRLSVPMPKKKVDFTALGDEILRRSGMRTWDALGGARRLAAHGIVDLDRARRWMGRYSRAGRGRPAQMWRLLSAEAWLRSHDL